MLCCIYMYNKTFDHHPGCSPFFVLSRGSGGNAFHLLDYGAVAVRRTISTGQYQTAHRSIERVNMKKKEHIILIISDPPPPRKNDHDTSHYLLCVVAQISS